MVVFHHSVASFVDTYMWHTNLEIGSLRMFFTALFTLLSRGCSQSVQFAGTIIM